MLQALRQGAERLVLITQAIMKEVLGSLLGRNGPLGGVRFDLEVRAFVSAMVLITQASNRSAIRTCYSCAFFSALPLSLS